ncbi:hypothetical protein [Primorskyibacter sp. S87]|uniref:hypothetical protein n=1 Tax=Primorskyibacter sp. S87 TaxID=3415126 RepID=UPI003C7EBA94
MFRLICCSALIISVAACAPRHPDDDDAEIAAVSYRDPGPSSLTLYTVVNNRTGGGGHSSLMVNGPERVLFDPAGSFYADVVPEKNDVLYGITPSVEKAYRSAHARSTYHVVSQTIEVTPEQANLAYNLVRQNGPVAGAFCANATSSVLRQIPGFEQIQTTYYPVKLQEQLEQIPGVKTEKYYENDDEDLQQGLVDGNVALNATAGG